MYHLATIYSVRQIDGQTDRLYGVITLHAKQSAKNEKQES